MSKLPVLRPAEVVRILLEMGFVEVRHKDHINNLEISKGAAPQLHFIRGEDISLSLLLQIAKDIGMTAEEFIRNQ